ncbi:timeless protein-domain-containing protein [Cladochytrium replicatum]|nr:timeless protein-domain-containing protein [Cladochytrium replicatum]
MELDQARDERELERAKQLKRIFDQHLLQTCTAIGGIEKRLEQRDGSSGRTEVKVFILGDECLACLRDLRRYLRRDDETTSREVFRMLGRWNILQTTLVPLIRSGPSDPKVLMGAVEIIVPLTWPILPEAVDFAPEELEFQMRYKEALTNENVICIFRDLLVEVLKIEEKTEKDYGRIRLLISFFRNLLAISDIEAGIGSSAEGFLRSSLQEVLVNLLSKTQVVDILIGLAASIDEPDHHDWNLVIMEIFYLLFRDRDPVELAKHVKETGAIETNEIAHGHIKGADGAKSESTKDKRNETSTTSTRTTKEKRPFRSGFPPTRHSRFGGTLSIKFSNGNQVHVHNPLTAMKSIDSAINLAKNDRQWSRPVDQGSERIRSIRNSTAHEAYARAAKLFVENAFNSLVESVKKDIDRELMKIRAEDCPRLLRLSAFSLRFQRTVIENMDASETDPAYEQIAVMLHQRTTLFFLKQIRLFQEMKASLVRANKTKWDDLQVALDCFSEVLQILRHMMASPNPLNRQVADNIQRNLYYDPHSVDLLLGLCRDHKRMNTRNLESLVRTIANFMDLLKAFTKVNEVVIVKKKARKQRKKAQPHQTEDGMEAAKENTGGAQDVDVYEDDEEEGPSRKVLYEERAITMQKVEEAFSNEGVVSAYVHLLSNYRQITDHQYFQHITVMLHRIFVKHKHEAFLYKLSTIILLRRFMSDRLELQQSEGVRNLAKFIEYAFGRLVKRVSHYPPLLIEFFFSKTKSDCARIASNGDANMPTRCPKVILLEAIQYRYLPFSRMDTRT